MRAGLRQLGALWAESKTWWYRRRNIVTTRDKKIGSHKTSTNGNCNMGKPRGRVQLLSPTMMLMG